MQIILPQSEIEEAVRETVLSQISIKADQTISITFEETDSGTIAIIDVTKGEAQTEAPVKKTRAKRGSKKAAKEEPKSVDDCCTADYGNTKQETAEKAKDAPWEEEETEAKSEPENQEKGNQEASQKEEEKPVQETAASKEAPKIFPDANSSVPVEQPKDTPPAPKSLFSNLTKPVNGTNGANGTNGSAGA